MSFLQTSMAQFRHYKALAEKAMIQVDDASLLHEASGDNSSFIVIIKHLHGNMLSRWTAYLTEDGEKPWRERDAEFLHEALTRDGLLQLWEEGWARVFDTLASLTNADLDRTIHIRSEAMTAMDGIIRQQMHYAYHVGQIVLLCKQQVKHAWQSLSIPKGETAAYNAALFTQAKDKQDA